MTVPRSASPLAGHTISCTLDSGQPLAACLAAPTAHPLRSPHRCAEPLSSTISVLVSRPLSSAHISNRIQLLSTLSCHPIVNLVRVPSLILCAHPLTTASRLCPAGSPPPSYLRASPASKILCSPSHRPVLLPLSSLDPSCPLPLPLSVSSSLLSQLTFPPALRQHELLPRTPAASELASLHLQPTLSSSQTRPTASRGERSPLTSASLPADIGRFPSYPSQRVLFPSTRSCSTTGHLVRVPGLTMGRRSSTPLPRRCLEQTSACPLTSLPSPATSRMSLPQASSTPISPPGDAYLTHPTSPLAPVLLPLLLPSTPRVPRPPLRPSHPRLALQSLRPA